jgi:Helix-turn-helix domain
MVGVIQMSDRELTRLRVMIDLADDRLTVDAAATLMGLGRRQLYRLRRAFSADGPAGLASRKRGRPSNRKHGESFRATVLSLVREHYIDFGPTQSGGTRNANEEPAVAPRGRHGVGRTAGVKGSTSRPCTNLKV